MMVRQGFNPISRGDVRQRFGPGMAGSPKRYWVATILDTQQQGAEGEPWSDVTYVEALDDSVAEVTLSVGQVSNILSLTKVDFSNVPATGTPCGLVVGLHGRRAAGVTCSLCKLIDHNGSAIGENRSAECLLPILAVGTHGNITIGEVSSLTQWGNAVAALTLANFQHANFGLQLQFTNAGAAKKAQIDYAWITLYYTL